MRTSPALGLGISRSTIWKSAPALGTCATFIGAIPTFVVAIFPPHKFANMYCEDFLKSLDLDESITSRTCPSLRNLEDELQFNRDAEGKTCDAIHQARRVLVFSE